MLTPRRTAAFRYSLRRVIVEAGRPLTTDDVFARAVYRASMPPIAKYAGDWRPQYRPLAERMLAEMAEAGEIVRDGERWASA